MTDEEIAEGRRRGVPLWIMLTAALGVLMLVGGLALAVGKGNPHAVACLIVAPILFAVTVPIARRLARAENDQRYVAIIMSALVLKFAGALVRYYVAFVVYRGNDAKEYDQYGRYIAHQLRHGHVPTGLTAGATGTGFMHYATGVVYAIFGSSIVAGFLVFSWLGFLGLLLFWRAFRRAVPQGDGHRYALLVLLLPSLVYWPSSIGKEAWMLLCLGVCAYGCARILTSQVGTGLLVLVIGIAGCLVVRPHLGLLIVIALAFAALMRPPKGVSPLVMFFLAGAIIVGGLVVISSTKSFFGIQNLTQESVTTSLDSASNQTAEGGSQFAPVRVHTGLEMPWATVTVLFRPLPYEAHNLQGLIAASEGLFLIAISALSWRRMANAIRISKESSYVAFALGFVLAFVYAFSAFSNFGILARQRTQVLPLYLVLLALPPIARRPPKRTFDEPVEISGDVS